MSARGRRQHLPWMRLDGREDVSPVVFWEEGVQPLLGAVTLEIFSLNIDPVNERLIPVDAFMLASGTGSNPHRSNCANSDNDTEQPLESDGENTGLTPSTAKLKSKEHPHNFRGH